MTTKQAAHVNLPWVTWHPWVALQAVRVHDERTDGSLPTCQHLQGTPTTFAGRNPSVWVDLAQSAVLCWECFGLHLEQLPTQWVEGRGCDGCLLRDGLVTTFVQHEALPEYILLVALCDQCAPHGPVISE